MNTIKKKYTKFLYLHLPTGSLWEAWEYNILKDQEIKHDCVRIGRLKTYEPTILNVEFDTGNREWRIKSFQGSIIKRYKVTETQYARIVAVKLLRQNII